MDIACSTDDNYAMPTGVMLTSLFENNKGESIHVHVMHGGLQKENADRLRAVAEAYGQTISFRLVDKAQTGDLPIGRDWQNEHVGQSVATYYRLFLARLLPEGVERVIYLDGDMLVLGSLRGLWHTDMQGKAVAAVPDAYTDYPVHYNRLRYPQREGYFNAGMMLVNLDHWRENGMTERFVRYIRDNADRLAYHDQDVLNAVLRHEKVTLPLKYNMLDEYWFAPGQSIVSWQYEEQMKEGRQNPVIVHFTCVPKPWYSNCKHPCKKLFDRYLAMTPWRGRRQRPWMKPSYLAERLCAKAVVMAGLRKADYLIENKYVKLDQKEGKGL